jgi:hypothetical protein
MKFAANANTHQKAGAELRIDRSQISPLAFQEKQAENCRSQEFNIGEMMAEADKGVAKVYVPQIPNRKDKATGIFVPVVNIAPAAEFGEPVILLPANTSFYAVGDLTTQLRAQLRQYDCAAGDSIVAIGDPAIMAVVFGMLGNMFGKFYVLKWDRSIGRYSKIKVVL